MKSKNNGKLLTKQITCCALPIADKACHYFSSFVWDINIKITFGKQFAE
ncbi:hypothetical protein [Nostoc sp.]